MKIQVTEEEWLRALESGEFKQGQGAFRKQGQGAFRRAESFCCLGVMCEIDENTARWAKESYSLDDNNGLAVFSCALDAYRPEWMSSRQESACIMANDKLGWSFAQIAKWWRSGAKVATNGYYPVMS